MDDSLGGPTALTTHPELHHEQAYFDRAYERLDAMRRAVHERMQAVIDQGRGTPQAISERDIVVRSSLQRLEQLDIGPEPLIFGRIDRAAENGTPPETFYIGRLAVWGAEQEPLVVDWRAPVAEPFYRATGRHPMGLRRRRHFAADHGRLTGIEDEVFEGDAAADGGIEIAGPGALLAALGRTRSGRMRDIVATVQREQDEVIRAPLPGVLVVQGGPGTGKTAVALHRAAYLLYTHRFPLETQGVLVVGPNPVFMRYIEHVLPSLGETGVSLATIDGLLSDTRPRAADSREAARIKGDPRMAKVVAKAVRDRQRALPADVDIPYGPYNLRITVAASAEIVGSVRHRGGPHNARRRQVERLVARRLHSQYVAAVDRARRTEIRGPVDTRDIEASELFREVRRDPRLSAALDRMWPVLTSEELLHDLFGARSLIGLATRGVLEEHEAAMLHRRRSTSLDTIPWTSADLALLDEARVLLGPRRGRASEDSEVRSFGHIVVDEAQDLSPMQLRALARRSISGSMTVVGDVAQATGAWAPERWAEVLRYLPTRHEAQVVELSVNYRTPAEIMEVASRLLPEAAPFVRPPASVRRTDQPPVIRAVEPADLLSGVARAASELAAAVDGGTVAVICPPAMTDDVGAALAAAGIRYGEPERSGLDEAVTVVPVTSVKGLEFDGVVVVEPTRLVREASQGLRALFVALTRPTQRLTIVHAEPLPTALQ